MPFLQIVFPSILVGLTVVVLTIRKYHKTQEEHEHQEEERRVKQRETLNEAICQSAKHLLYYLTGDDDINPIRLAQIFEKFNTDFNSIPFPTSIYSPEEIKKYFQEYASDNRPVQNETIEFEKNYTLLRILIVMISLDVFNKCETIDGLRLALVRGKKFLNAGLLSHLMRLDAWRPFINRFDWDVMIGWILKKPTPSFTPMYVSYPGEYEEKLEICRQWNSELKVYFDEIQEDEIKQEKINIKARLSSIKEELIASALHPKRVEKWVKLDSWDMFD